MECMLNWRIACLALSFSFLLLAFGCFALEEGTAPANAQKEDTMPADPLALCASACEKSFSHSVGSIKNGNCTCPCENGYQRYNGTCITLQEYDYFFPEICKSECDASIPRSSGIIRNGSCTCACKKGYVSYNRTCITPRDFEKLAPTLCSEEYPVLKIYDWSYKEKGNYIYLCYKNESAGGFIEDRSNRRDYWNFVGDPYSNGSVSIVTDLLVNISKREGFSKYEQIEFAIAFVQSLPYTFDNVSTPYDNYPRFPSETIYADGGDCEDTAILMAAILKKLGYDVVLLELPRHLATGVFCNPSDFNYTVAAYPYNGRDYCYLETTGEGYDIGKLPAIYASAAEVAVIPLRIAQPDLYIGWNQESDYRYVYAYNARDTYVNVTDIRIDNFGTLPAKNVKIYVALEATEEGKVWSQYTYTVGDIPVRGAYSDYSVTNLHAPTGKPFRVSVAVYGDNFKSIESAASWVTWQ
jgi:hypothetical protein